MLKKFKLTFAERHLVQQLLNDITKLDITGARFSRTIYETLELRSVRKTVDELSEIYKKTDAKFVRWGDLLDFGNDADAKKENKPRSFTMDDSALSWLQDRLKEHDWNKQVVINSQTGTRTEHEVPLPLEQAIVLANLTDALANAEDVYKEEK